ncbi:MAG TPA: helix-turn-helix transcriptional regulator, partial [Fimbriimonadaceae bacterium]|nr:helix-turn-helix transcriptional regulator [Fimbriimonadaceae bacterium]
MSRSFAPKPPRSIVLGARALDVLRGAARGLTNREIAEELLVSSRTVDSHLSQIYRRLDVVNRVQAIRTAEKLG